MTYLNAVRFLYNLEKFGIKLSLDNIRRLLSRFDNPHLKLSTIHVAGTNGKGSTSAMIESILCNAGFKTGLYTSPHLVDVRERIRICGDYISKKKFTRYLKQLQPDIVNIEATFFESMTAMAFLCFSEENVDVAVVETGLGGRFDATNIVEPIITVITNIGFDHMNRLGYSLTGIAFEKSGIMKQNIPCVTGVYQEDVLQELRWCAQKQNVQLYEVGMMTFESDNLSITGSNFHVKTDIRNYNDLFLNLSGTHQIENAIVAIRVCELLDGYNISEKAIKKGLADVNWKGRFQIISQKSDVLIDVAHNLQGIQAFTKNYGLIFGDEKPIIVMGVMKDKESRKMIKYISSLSDYFISVTPDWHRSLDAGILAKIAKDHFKYVESEASVYSGMSRAMTLAKKMGRRVVLIGSHFTIGEWLKSQK